jgi:hypothetical protein
MEGRQRQQPGCGGGWFRVVGALVGTALWTRTAAGADLWTTAPLFLQPSVSASTSWGILAGGGWAAGLVPPFRAAERDRASIDVGGGVWVGDRVLLRGAWSWLRDDSRAGGTASGPGDIRLGTVARLGRTGDVRWFLGWEAKFPDAANEDELGTDETDVLFGGSFVWERGPWWATGAVGLGILGNPLRFANQDDVPMVRAAVGRRWGVVSIAAGIDADLATSRNPSRVEPGLDVSAGKRVFVAVHGGAGVVPAAADLRVTASIGLRWPLPDAEGGE